MPSDLLAGAGLLGSLVLHPIAWRRIHRRRSSPEPVLATLLSCLASWLIAIVVLYLPMAFSWASPF